MGRTICKEGLPTRLARQQTHPGENVDDVLAQPTLPHATAKIEVVGLDLRTWQRQRNLLERDGASWRRLLAAPLGGILAAAPAHQAVSIDQHVVIRLDWGLRRLCKLDLTPRHFGARARGQRQWPAELASVAAMIQKIDLVLFLIAFIAL